MRTQNPVQSYISYNFEEPTDVVLQKLFLKIHILLLLNVTGNDPKLLTRVAIVLPKLENILTKLKNVLPQN